MNKVISFKTFKKYCRASKFALTSYKVICGSTGYNFKNYHKDCNAVNCPLWKRLKDAK